MHNLIIWIILRGGSRSRTEMRIHQSTILPDRAFPKKISIFNFCTFTFLARTQCIGTSKARQWQHCVFRWMFQIGQRERERKCCHWTARRLVWRKISFPLTSVNIIITTFTIITTITIITRRRGKYYWGGRLPVTWTSWGRWSGCRTLSSGESPSPASPW